MHYNTLYETNCKYIIFFDFLRDYYCLEVNLSLKCHIWRRLAENAPTQKHRDAPHRLIRAKSNISIYFVGANNYSPLRTPIIHLHIHTIRKSISPHRGSVLYLRFYQGLTPLPMGISSLRDCHWKIILHSVQTQNQFSVQTFHEMLLNAVKKRLY